MTQIKIPVDLKEKLDKLKLVDRETYYSVIERKIFPKGEK